MAIQYTFKVLELNVAETLDGKANVVQAITWACFAEDVGVAVAAYGIAVLNEPTKNFVQYEDLTEAEVLGWLEAAIPDSEKREIYLDLERQINERRFPKIVVKPLPWVTK